MMDFAELIAPIKKEDFFSEYWEKKPLIIKRQNANFYSKIFSFSTQDDVLTGREALSKECYPVGDVTYPFSKDKELNLKKLFEHYAKGNTILSSQAYTCWKPLQSLRRNVQSELKANMVNLNCYLTPELSQGFRPHYDPEEVFILQLEGSKFWKLYHTPFEFPNPKQEWHRLFPKGFNLGDSKMEIELLAGDLLYIPKGMVHEAKCLEKPSLHITLGVFPFLWEDFLRVILDNLESRSREFGNSLSAQDLFANLGRLKEMCCVEGREIFEEKQIQEALDEYSYRWSSQQGIEYEGLLEMIDCMHTNSLDTRIRLRDPFHYAIEGKVNGVTLFFHESSLDLTTVEYEAFRFVLSNKECQIKDFPDELDDREKLEFVRLLILECVVILL
jgi:ribosomal protein L16 Arg81 hydroxylase